MRILFLTQRLPYAPNRGDRIRALQELRFLARRHEVTVVSLAHDAEEASHAGDLDSVAAETVVARIPHLRNRGRALLALPGRRPLTHVLLDSPAMRPALERLVRDRPPDVVLAFCSSMARFALAPPLDTTPTVIDMVDVDSAKWADLSRHAAPPMRWIYAREARLLGAFETRAVGLARSTFVVNARERDALAALGAGKPVHVIENGIDLAYYTPAGPVPRSRTVVFCGVMDYAPNEAGAVWLARDVWPHVRQAVPDAALALVGARPTARVQALESAEQGILVTGPVPDVRPHLWGAAVAAAPLQVARGVQNKVLEAVAAGLPTVVTPAVHQGLPGEVLPACVLADDAAAFAAAIVRLLRSTSSERRALVERCTMTDLGWETKLRPLDDLIEQAAAPDRRG